MNETPSVSGAREIYQTLRVITEPIHAYDDQMIAIAHWIKENYTAKHSSHPFPNGFESWHETHFVVSAEIALRMEYELDPAIIARVLTTQGRTGLYQLVSDLTDKFESAHSAADWFEQDFYEEVARFLKKELY